MPADLGTGQKDCGNLCQNRESQNQEVMEKIDLPSISDPLWVPVEEFRQVLRNKGFAEEELLTDEQIAAIQDFVLRFSRIICDMIFAGELPLKEV